MVTVQKSCTNCQIILDVGIVCWMWEMFARCGKCLLDVGIVCWMWELFAGCGICLLDVGNVCKIWELIARCGNCLLDVGIVCWSGVARSLAESADNLPSTA